MVDLVPCQETPIMEELISLSVDLVYERFSAISGDSEYGGSPLSGASEKYSNTGA